MVVEHNGTVFETNFRKLCACVQVCTSASVQALLQLVTLPQGHTQMETIAI